MRILGYPDNLLLSMSVAGCQTTIEVLDKVLPKMGLEYRMIIQRRYQLHQSYREIAIYMHISDASAKRYDLAAVNMLCALADKHMSGQQSRQTIVTRKCERCLFCDSAGVTTYRCMFPQCVYDKWTWARR